MIKCRLIKKVITGHLSQIPDFWLYKDFECTTIPPAGSTVWLDLEEEIEPIVAKQMYVQSAELWLIETQPETSLIGVHSQPEIKEYKSQMAKLGWNIGNWTTASGSVSKKRRAN